MRAQKGITLVALIITIIVLLILAVVTIASINGQDGVVTEAQEAIGKHEDGVVEQNKVLGNHVDVLDYYNNK